MEVTSALYVNVVYKDQFQSMLVNQVSELRLKQIFGISDNNIFLRDLNGNLFFPERDGKFIDLNQKIYQIASDSEKYTIEEIKIPPSEAKFVFTNGNWYTSNYLLTGYSTANSNMRRSFIKFADLSPLVNQKIIKCVFQIVGLIKPSNQFSASNQEVFIHRVLTPWENLVAWGNQPIFSGVPESSCIVGETYEVPFTWNITELVKGWAKGTVKNYGVCLRSSDVYGVESAKLFYANHNEKQATLIAYVLR